MKIYDISQEVLSCVVFPGDPAPKKEEILRLKNGEKCNLSAFYMCAHNGTHIDAPFHFIDEGKTVEEVALEKFVGECFVTEKSGFLSEEEAEEILAQAKKINPDCAKKILLKGDAVVTEDAAKVFAAEPIDLIGCEGQSVGADSAPKAVHEILLSREVVLLEGLRLGRVGEGEYFLSAAPLNLAGFDGSPVRAYLIEKF